MNMHSAMKGSIIVHWVKLATRGVEIYILADFFYFLYHW